MTLPASGAISLNDVNIELGRSSGTSINMNESAVRTLFGVPSGAISMSNGYGKSNIPPGQVSYTTGNNTYTFTVPANVTSISVAMVGGGGSGNQNYYPGGGGGGLVYKNNIPVTPGQTFDVTVGRGGQPSVSSSASQLSGGVAGGPYSSNFLVAEAGNARGTSVGGQYSGTVAPYSGSYGGRGGDYGGGGGGAGGYINGGGNGGNPGGPWAFSNGTSGGSPGGGGGGGASGGPGYGGPGANGGTTVGAGGGGVGLFGEGTAGAGGTATSAPNATGNFTVATNFGGGVGSGNPLSPASAGGHAYYTHVTGFVFCPCYGKEPVDYGYTTGGNGGAGGGGGGGGANTWGIGGSGAVRIIWPGTTRAFPSTNTGNM